MVLQIKGEQNFHFWKLLDVVVDTHIKRVAHKELVNTCYASPKLIVTWYLLNHMVANSNLIQKRFSMV